MCCRVDHSIHRVVFGRGGFVKERILNYMAYIDQLLADDAGKNEEDYEKIMEEHKLQLTFFMHERLVHLLVTLTFALLAFATFLHWYLRFSRGLWSCLLHCLYCLFHTSCIIICWRTASRKCTGSMMRCTSVHGRKVTRLKMT